MRRLLPALALAVTVLAAAVPAGAHGDEVQMEVIEQTPSDEGSSVTYLVALTYASDGDGIDDAVVTATISQEGEAPEPPITMTATGAGGGYAVTITFPSAGDWNIRFASVEPEAGVTTGFEVAAPPPATATSTPAPAPVPPPTSASVEPSLAEDDTDAGSDAPIGLFVGLATAGLLFVGAAIYVIRRRRRPRWGHPSAGWSG